MRAITPEPPPGGGSCPSGTSAAFVNQRPLSRVSEDCALIDEALMTRWSSASSSGRRNEDCSVAVCRPWPITAGGSPIKLQQHLAPSYHLFAVFDGHNGASAARCAEAAVVPALEVALPAWHAATAQLASQLQEALVLTCLELQRQVACAGTHGGCTATLVLQVGRLVTVASLGSSRCVLDPGTGPWVELSEDHTLSVSWRERQRLAAAGCHVAAQDSEGQGPAATPARGDGVPRLWPGGLKLGRSLGDFNIGEALLPLPHIKQVVLPPGGGRLVLATDGVWGHTCAALRRTMRAAPVEAAAQLVIKALRGAHSDASVIVADALPPGCDWAGVRRRQEQAQEQAAGRSGLRRALRLLGMTRSSSDPALASHVEEQPSVKLIADYDSADVLGLVPGSSGASLGRASAGGLSTRGSWARISSSGSSSSGSIRSWTEGLWELSAGDACCGGAADGDAACEPPSPWCTEGKAAVLLAAMVDAREIWRTVRAQHALTLARANRASLQRRSSPPVVLTAAAVGPVPPLPHIALGATSPQRMPAGIRRGSSSCSTPRSTPGSDATPLSLTPLKRVSFRAYERAIVAAHVRYAPVPDHGPSRPVAIPPAGTAQF
ncbi:putative phosphatase 2C 5 isoform X1 [Micractinium conductrix]|uniref:Phosphatase 2C 5 isoform X1 n=1 Tax=Micractinium conductrix TaxID=554055 RepID=A0A2P6V522_9CHLO|nr:putative phosphatase 2C 5 isoform X1 [Micractinium conductrix]|eukprot:PSC69174.1 putative phosphatase 2C 5 isoform X1 [Micractinium conductrix]